MTTRTYGEIRLDGDVWRIKAEPHVTMRLKQVFSRINKHKHGDVVVRNTPEMCRDLLWFLDRFPLHVHHPQELRAGSDFYVQTLEELEAIKHPDFVSRTFTLTEPLRQYQVEANEVYLRVKGLLVGDVVGLGKTVTAIGSFTQPEAQPALVVVKPHLARQWREAVQHFMPEANPHIIKQRKYYDLPSSSVYIITYHKMDAWVEPLKGLIKSITFDEVQELRHSDTARYSAAKMLRSQVDFGLALSASPIYGYGGEAFNIFDIVRPGFLGDREEFVREWCCTRGDKILLSNPDAFGTYLRDNHLMLRRTRSEVGRELPPLQTVVEDVEHDSKMLASIDALATELAHRILSSDTEYFERGQAAREFDMRLRQITGIAKAPYVAAYVQMLVEGGETVLLGGWHREVYSIWEHHLTKAGIPICYYTGSESPAQKETSKQKFLSGEAKVMFMSLRSGDGVDGLQEVCSVGVIGELDWSPAVHDQFFGRLARDGQKNPVLAVYAVSDSGSDPTVANIVGIKRTQSAGITDPGEERILGIQNDGAGRVTLLAKRYLKQKAVK
jgi:SNF2 family DNA or RNA helicase